MREYEDLGRRRREQCVLRDRPWSRGPSIGVIEDERAKDTAPSSKRRWRNGHDPTRFTGFSDRCRRDPTESSAGDLIVHSHKAAARSRPLLFTATLRVEHSGAAALRSVIEYRGR
jgi:uncharacterized protein YeaO (DUF488 family)